MMLFLWILGIYGAAAASIHLVYLFFGRKTSDEDTNYVLVTKNSAEQIEWVLRLLHFYSWVKGRKVVVAIADEGSTDETMDIIERLSSRMCVELVSISADKAAEGDGISSQGNTIIIHLYNQEELRQVPLIW